MGTNESKSSYSIAYSHEKLGPVQLFSAGMYLSLVLTTSGKLFAFGKDGVSLKKFPKEIPYDGPPLRFLFAAIANSFFLTQSNDLYVYGENRYKNLQLFMYNRNGELAYGSFSKVPVIAPSVKSFFDNEHFEAISCKLYCIAVMQHDTSRIISWGSNEYGCLGNGSLSQQPVGESHVKLDIIQEKEQILRLVGKFDSVMVLTNTRVLSFGPNNEGQLGDSSFASKFQPVTVAKAFTSNVTIDISERVVAIDNGRVWVWGFMPYELAVKEPRPFNSIKEPAKNASVGCAHTVIVTVSNKLLTFGKNENYQLVWSTEVA